MEIWKEIKGYEGLYEVSNLGNVKSLNFNHTGKEKLLNTSNLRKEYHFVNIGNKNKNIHRLVAETFIPNPENKQQVNHINGIKTDNRLENLEWATPEENTRHAHYTGLGAKGEKHGMSKLSKEQVINIYKRAHQGEVQRKLANEFMVDASTVRGIKIGKTWSWLTKEIVI